MSNAPAFFIFCACGRTSPNESMTATGRRSSTKSSNRGRLAMLQVIKPTPTRASPAASNSRASQVSSPYPPPIMPKPPALLTVAASRPSETTSIGASRIGCLTFRSSVRRVEMDMFVPRALHVLVCSMVKLFIKSSGGGSPRRLSKMPASGSSANGTNLHRARTCRFAPKATDSLFIA